MAKDNNGRPAYDDDQYEIWLKELRPFLEQGKSLYRSIELSGLLTQKTTLYEKYKLNDWFSEKIAAYQKVLGEKINDTFVSLIEDIFGKVKRGEKLTDQEAKLLMFGAEKHRSAQPFFVNRFETAAGRPVEEVIDALEQKGDETIDDVNENLKAGENPEIPATTSPDPVTQEQAPPVATPPTEQPTPPIVEGQITPDTIDPNATPTT